MQNQLPKILMALLLTGALSACGGGNSPGTVNQGATNGGDVGDPATPDGGGSGDDSGDDPVAAKVFKIETTDTNPEEKALLAFFEAQEGDCVEWGEGTFFFTKTLQMAHKNGICLKGQGLDKTILDFSDSVQPEGIAMSHMNGITVEDLTIIDTPGFSIKISSSNHVVLKNMRAMWSSADGGMDSKDPSTLEVSCEYALSTEASVGFYTSASGLQTRYEESAANGGYAIYPVLSNNVLLDGVIAVGASDAGIYVGQSNEVEVKNSIARFNVAGYEIENTDDADVHDNLADCNTGGFLTFDLPGLNQYGDETRTYNNKSMYNNTPNFAPGGIVGAVPQGIGMLTLGYDEQEIFNNTFEGNRTAGVVFASHELLDGNTRNSDLRMDLHPEGWQVHSNIMTNNGYLPQPPSPDAITCAENPAQAELDALTAAAGVPDSCVPTGVDDSHPSLLPALITLKSLQNGAVAGAHIVWDGMYDKQPYNADLDADAPNDCTLELAHSTLDLNDPAELNDDKGKPQYDITHRPKCRYNAFKFETEMVNSVEVFKKDDGGNFIRKHPQFWGCIEDSDPARKNTYSNTINQSVPEFMDFQNTDPTSPASYDISKHDCMAEFGSTLEPLDAADVKFYQIGQSGTARLSDEEVLAICENNAGGTINTAALPYNCPKLSHYNLFSDATDPRTGPNGRGVLYDLNTPLFSDYASKYRFAFIPNGESAKWSIGSEAEPNSALIFPVGTVIAKTFAFKNGANENVVETRLLIHRDGDNGSFWEGLPYIWQTANGNRVDANLAIAGGKQAVTWNFDDEHVAGLNYNGSTNNYAIPTADQCGNCHNNEDRPAGDAPIGPKVRLMNGPTADGTENQLEQWIRLGLLTGNPALTYDSSTRIATNAPRLPRFLVEGDDFNIPNLKSPQADGSAGLDVEIRARSWLETNCAHCHNRKGLASSTGLYLDVFREVGLSYGVCKFPNTAGSSSNGNSYDFVPGIVGNHYTNDDDDGADGNNGSILSFRMHSIDSGTQMPPLARSVMHNEAVDLIDAWIDNVLDSSYPDAGCETGGAGL